MRFLTLIRINETSGQVPDERLMAEMGQLIEAMKEAGVLVDTAGLMPTKDGKRLRLSKGRIRSTDGAFTETKEVIGGYFMLKAASTEEASRWMERFLEAHGDQWEVECELRPLDPHFSDL